MNYYLNEDLGPWMTDTRPRNISQKTVNGTKTEQKELLQSVLSGRKEKLPTIRNTRFSVSPEPNYVKQQFFNKEIVIRNANSKLDQPHFLPKHHLIKMKPKSINFPKISMHRSVIHEQIVDEIEKIIRRNLSNKPKLTQL